MFTKLLKELQNAQCYKILKIMTLREEKKIKSLKIKNLEYQKHQEIKRKQIKKTLKFKRTEKRLKSFNF